jgi:N-acetylglucosamine-6-sulfatase
MKRCSYCRLFRFVIFFFLLVLLLLLLLTVAAAPVQKSTTAAAEHAGAEEEKRQQQDRDDDDDDENSAEQDNDDDDDTRPNILLLLTDDQDVMIGGLDRMQNLQHLLQERGMTYKQAFVHTPICCPSRSSIYSGRYLHNGGARDNSVLHGGNCNGRDWQQNAEQETFAVLAQRAGYATSFAGKYLNGYGIPGSPHCHEKRHDDDKHKRHHYDHDDDDTSGCTRVPPGWDKWLGLIGNSVYYDYSVVHSENGNDTAQVTVERHGHDYRQDYLPDLVANFTLRQMEHFLKMNNNKKQQVNGGKRRRKPFLAVVAWPTAHMPFTPAPWAEHVFPPDDDDDDDLRAHITPNYNASFESLQSKHWMMRWLAPIDNNTAADGGGSTAQWIDQVYANRTKALQSVDQHIAQFVHLLQQYDNEYNNTIIIYTSDNGWQLGQHRLSFDKRQLYEHDIRVPFIISGGSKMVPQNVTNQDDIVLNIDIAPTIYHIVTGTNPNDLDFMDGQSLLPTLSLQHQQHSTTNSATTIDKDTDNGSDDDDDEGLEKILAVLKNRRRRDDFLISYHGEGIQQCDNFWQCPVPDKEHYHMGDWTNNTYHCVRTIRIGKQQQQQQQRSPPTVEKEGADDEEEARVRQDDPDDDDDDDDSIYCRFSDDEDFVEYYDLMADPWQLHNAYDSLTLKQRLWYDGRLRELQSCRGQSCRRLRSSTSSLLATSQLYR